MSPMTKSPSSLTNSHSHQTTIEELAETIHALNSKIEMLVGMKPLKPTHEEEKKKKQQVLRVFDQDHFLKFVNSEEFDEIMEVKLRSFAPSLISLR